MANHLQPTVTSTYSNFLIELDGRLDDLAVGLDPATTTATNVPTGSIRWSSASNKWQKFNGTTWADLSSLFSISISGNAATVSNGVYTTGTYTNPTWITSLAGSKITGDIAGTAANATQLLTARNINGVAFNGTAAISINLNNSVTFNNTGTGAASGASFNGGSAATISYNTVGAPSATGTGASGSWGISITGNAATATNAGSVTNGVYTVGDQTIAGVKTFSSRIVGKTGGTDNVASISVATTGGSFASMYATRRGTPYHTFVSHTGSSYAPSFGVQYEYTGGYTGIYSIGHLATGLANPGSFAIHHINSGNTEDRAWLFTGASGDFTSPGNVTAYSDERLKSEWSSLSNDFIELLAKVKSGTYTRIDTNIRQVGVSAQSLKLVMPEAVIEGDILSVSYGNAALAAAVELAKESCSQKAQINILTQQVNNLSHKLIQLLAKFDNIA
jgi:hypothetical protein